MSFRCTLSFLNKVQRRDDILSVYNIAKATGNHLCYAVVLLWMFEYVCSYYFINKETDVCLNTVLRAHKFSSNDLSLLNQWSNIRNNIAHYDFPLKRKELLRLYECGFDIVFDNFEEDKVKFIEVFKDCCRVLIDNSVDFNKAEYLHHYCNYLPQASAEACVTEEDCDALLDRLGLSK